MQFLDDAILLFSIAAFAVIIVGSVLVRVGRVPGVQTYRFLTCVCAVTLLANLLGSWPLTALPWMLCMPLWDAHAALLEARD